MGELGIGAGWDVLSTPSAQAGFAVIVLACALIALRGLAPLLAFLALALRR